MTNIDRIIERTDFKKIKKYMDSVDWRWQGQIPSLDDLEYTARYLLSQIEDSSRSTSAGTGGFWAYKHVYQNYQEIQLVFSIETNNISTNHS